MKRRDGYRGLAVASILFTLTGCGLGSLFTETRTSFRPAEPESLRQRLELEPRQPNQAIDHFAVLIGAETELRHRGNLSMAYQVLLEQGYRRENVFIFDSEGSTAFFPNTDFTSLAALRALFEHLAKVVEAHDTLFVYVTGHGRRITADEQTDGKTRPLGVSTLVLNPGEELAQDDFATLLESVNPGVGIAFFDQCYWGQFARPKLCNWVVVTTSEPDETSHGVSFPRAFFGAFRSRPSDDPPTIFEAFKLAMVSDPATRTGQNRPRISHGCVNPASVLLTGQMRSSESILKARASQNANATNP